MTSTYPHAAVKAAVGCSTAQFNHWVKILGSTAHDRELTGAEAVAIAAVEHLRSCGVPRKKLERPFAQLAFRPPDGSDWMLVREPRQDPRVVEGVQHHDVTARQTYVGAAFHPGPFLARLDDRD